MHDSFTPILRRDGGFSGSGYEHHSARETLRNGDPIQKSWFIVILIVVYRL